LLCSSEGYANSTFPRDPGHIHVDPSKHCVVVADVPHVIADVFESNVLALERIAQEVLTGESEGSTAAHSPYLEVAGIFGLPEAAWVLPGWRLPPLGREVAAECFVRTLVVIALLEEIQLPLLLGEIRGRRTGRLSLHVLVHPLVLTVLLRARRADSLMNDPELHPPDIEFAQPVDSRGSERSAIVGPDRVGKPVSAKQGPEGGLRAFGANRSQRLAEQEHSTVGVRHGQRKTVLPVAGLERPLEVRGPDLVRPRCLQAHGARMFPGLPAPILSKMAVSIQDLVDRTSGRKASTRMPSLQDLAQLGGSPVVLLSKQQDLALDVFRRSVRMAIGSPRAVIDRLQALRLDPVDPLVAGGPGDLISVTQLAHRPLATRVVAIEMLTLLLGVGFHPGHPFV